MKPYLKIMVTQKHDLNQVREIINSKKPAVLMLESENKENNLKTLYITQKLLNEGFKSEQMKFYKGALFKVILSKMTP